MKYLVLFFLMLISFPVFGQTKHTVKKQETLYSISKKYSITLDNLKKWNRLTSNAIAVGQVLLVTDPFVKTIVNKEEEKQQLFQTTNTNLNHVVKKGETLFKIAKLYSVSLSDIKTLNKLKTNEISIGQTLLIKPLSSAVLLENPTDQFLNLESFKKVEFTSDHTLESFLSEKQMSLSELQQLNVGIDLTNLREGQLLNIIEPSRASYSNPYLETKDVLATTSPDSTTVVHKTIPTFIYTNEENGQITTNGELINQSSLTIAHPDLSFGSIVTIVNKSTNKYVFARVNDRTIEKAIKITEAIKKAVEYNPTAQHEIILIK